MPFHTNAATARRLAILAGQDAPRGALRGETPVTLPDIPPAPQNGSQALVVVVPMLPVTVNHMYVSRRGGGKALTVEARAFRDEVAYAAGDAARSGGWSYREGARLMLTVRLTFSSAARQDLDNRLKAALDALALALHFDDACIDRIVAERLGVVKGRPRCELLLEVL